jgi:hypothetical protein
MFPLTQTPATLDESLPLASAMSEAYRGYVEAQMKYLALPADAAISNADELAAIYAERAERGDPRHATFCELASLAKVDPDRAKKRWKAIQAAARAELRTGHRAAKVNETSLTSEAWTRASFLALRDELAEAWQPQNGVDRTLVDMMAQAWTAQLFWQERMMLFACIEFDNERIKKEGRWETPRVADSEAVEQAAQMVDRFNRIFMRTLRMMKDLRRHAPTLVVQNVGQMNVAEQQINMAQT